MTLPLQAGSEHPLSSVWRGPATRVSFLVAVAAATLLGVPGPALGHTEVVSTVPAAGASVASPPTHITITYEGTLLRVVKVTVTRKAGGQIARSAKVNAKNAHQVVVLTSPGAPGHYTVAWKVQGADSHVMAGTFTFTVKRLRPIA